MLKDGLMIQSVSVFYQMVLKKMDSMDNEFLDLQRQLAHQKQLNANLVQQIEQLDDESKERANHNFVQLYKQELQDLRGLTQADKNAATILLIMVEKMNKQNALIISQKALETITGKSRTTIHRAIKTLREHKYIEIVKVGTANAYVVNSSVFWQANAKAKSKMSVFEATVVTTFDEQDTDYQENWSNLELKKVPMLNQKEIPIEAPEG